MTDIIKSDEEDCQYGDERWVIYAVTDSGKVLILKTGKAHPSLQEWIDNWEYVDATSDEAPGVYCSMFEWHSRLDWESGIDDGEFVISGNSTLLYLLPDVEVPNEQA